MALNFLPVRYDIELDESVPPVQNGPWTIPHVMWKAVQELRALED